MRGRLGFAALSAALAVTAPRAEIGNAVPGGVVSLDLLVAGAEAPQVYFGSRRVLVRRRPQSWQALIGIDLATAPGDYVVRINHDEQQREHRVITVRPRRPAEHAASEQNGTRANRDYPPAPPRSPPVAWRPRLDAALPLASPLDHGAVQAVQDRFGVHRLTPQGVSRRDVALEFDVVNDTLVQAPGGGRISAVVPVGPRALAVYLDHGMGLVTGVYPLTESLVNPDDPVTRGIALGRLAPPLPDLAVSLRWTVQLNGVFVNPLLFSDLPTGGGDFFAPSQ